MATQTATATATASAFPTTKHNTVTRPPIEQKVYTTPLVSLVSGAIAGGVEGFATFPFEFAKTRLQLRSDGAAVASPYHLLRDIVAQDGVSAIYTGCGSLVAGTALKAGVRFITYDSIKAMLSDETGRLSPARGMLAGMAAGAVESVVAVTPTERIKTALIDDAKGARRFRSTTHAVRLLVQEQGLTGIYRGLLSTTFKQSATSATRMGSYNVLRTGYRDRFGTTPDAAGTFAIGAVAGIITVYVTQPFDTIKTRSQSAEGEGMRVAIRGVLLQDGVRGFWKGSSMRLGRLIFSGGIVFSVYEQIASQLRGLRW